jgi:hypothetical protein
MRRKIVHAITSAAAQEDVYARAAAADDVLGVRITPLEIVWPRFFKRLYLPYAEIVWAYLSIQETEMQTGEFDGGSLVDVRLVLFDAAGRWAAIRFDRPSYGEAALRLMQQSAPDIAYGATPENRAKFAFAMPTWQK